MPKTKILLVHGMAEKDSRWFEDAKYALKPYLGYDIEPVHWYSLLQENIYSKIALLFTGVTRVLLTAASFSWAGLFNLFSNVIFDNLHKASLIIGYKSVRENAFTLLDKATSEPDTQYIIIAHSLGAILTYEYLRESQPSNVKRFISLGTPIDRQPIKKSVQHRMAGIPELKVEWCNVWGDEDPVVCWTPKISGQINSFRTTRQHRASGLGHDLVEYINNIPKDWLI